MAMRLHRVTDAEWQRLAAARRTQDLVGPPARASISAIELELRALDPAAPDGGPREYPQAAAG